MSNESLEQRARELLAAEFVKDEHTAAAARRLEADNATPVEQAAIAAIIRALESTPAQGVELPPTEEFALRAMAHNYVDDKGRPAHNWDGLDRDVCIRAAEEIKSLRAALSARTAPAEGEPVAWVVKCNGKFESAWLRRDLAECVLSAYSSESGAEICPLYERLATTSPVAGDVTWPIPEIECIDQYFRSGNSVAIEKATISAQHWHAAMQVIRAAAADAWRWKHIHEYAAEHGIEATSLLGLIRKLLKDHAIDSARPAKAEGDAQDAARYRFARNNMQIAFLNPYRWFPNPLGLDAAIDAAMQEDTARTVSRGDA